jgi:hypothetical protein
MLVVGKVEPPVVAALIAAAASLLVAVLGQIANRRTSVRVGKLEEERDERRARRDYEYEARKRLYEECEPVVFQAMELTLGARRRVLSLARTARAGWLPRDGSGGWLGSPDYYFKSSAFLLFAPATCFRMLQSRLTVIDLTLEQRLRVQYELLKQVFLSFNADFDLANCTSPHVLPYEPDKTDADQPERLKLLEASPQQYARQGLYRGILDVVIEALIVEADGSARGGARCMTFGEFLRAWDDEKSHLYATRDVFLELLSGFHPAQKPVLWRILCAQYLLYTVLLSDDPLASGPRTLSDEEVPSFDWRRGPDEASDDEIRAPLLAAETYVEEQLAALRAAVPRLERPEPLHDSLKEKLLPKRIGQLVRGLRD